MDGHVPADHAGLGEEGATGTVNGITSLGRRTIGISAHFSG